MVRAKMQEADFYPEDTEDKIMVDCGYITITLQVPRDFPGHAGYYQIKEDDTDKPVLTVRKEDG